MLFMDPQKFAVFKENVQKLSWSDQIKHLLFQAAHQPDTLNEDSWTQLVDEIHQKAVLNMKNGRIAAKICDYLATCELNLTADTREKFFRKVLLSRLQKTFKKHKSQNYKDRNSWIGFVAFLCAIFDILHINNMPLMTLILPVYEVLGILTDPEFASDDSIVQCLVVQMQFVGEELDRLNKQKMDELIEKIRTFMCSESMSQLSCLMVLEIIELRSGQWKLSPAAYQYYYEEVAAK